MDFYTKLTEKVTLICLMFQKKKSYDTVIIQTKYIPIEVFLIFMNVRG